jgi:putative membrane protein
MSVLFKIVAAVTLGGDAAWADSADGGIRSAAWAWPPDIVIPVFLAAVLYAVGVANMQRRNCRPAMLRIFCFLGGWLSLLFALDSPVHEVGEQLFWVHMTQHEILMLLSAPLLVLGQPAGPFLWALPKIYRLRVASASRLKVIRRSWSAASAPLSAWLLHAVALWAWHAPLLFAAALENDFVHAAQHLSFFGTALIFWGALFHHHGGRLGYGGAILYLFTTAVHTSVLGAWLTFAPSAWYTHYQGTAPLWGLTALQDQQVGGLIMWIPAGTVLTMVALALLGKWLVHSERRWEYTRTAAFIRASQGTAE